MSYEIEKDWMPEAGFRVMEYCIIQCENIAEQFKTLFPETLP